MLEMHKLKLELKNLKKEDKNAEHMSTVLVKVDRFFDNIANSQIIFANVDAAHWLRLSFMLFSIDCCRK